MASCAVPGNRAGRVSLTCKTSSEPDMTAKIERVLFNILVKDLTTSAAFYRQLADFEQIYTSDWYIVLAAPGLEAIELGLIDQVSEFTPRQAGGLPAGGYLTLVVDDVYAAYEKAREMGVDLIEEPRAQDYGQTRALLRDPNGIVLDISTPTEKLSRRLAEGIEAGDTTSPSLQ